MTLVPCSRCARHVRTDDSACPFCGSAIVAIEPPPLRDLRGVSRAMLLAGATMLAACGKEPAPPTAPSPAPSDDHGSMRTLYGAPPPPQPHDTSAPAPMYGAPPDMMTAPVPTPAPPADAGRTDAGKPKK